MLQRRFDGIVNGYEKVEMGSNRSQPLFNFVSQEKVIFTVKQARLELYEISL